MRNGEKERIIGLPILSSKIKLGLSWFISLHFLRTEVKFEASKRLHCPHILPYLLSDAWNSAMELHSSSSLTHYIHGPVSGTNLVSCYNTSSPQCVLDSNGLMGGLQTKNYSAFNLKFKVFTVLSCSWIGALKDIGHVYCIH